MILNMGLEHSIETAKIFALMGITGIMIGLIFDTFREFHISFKKVGAKFDMVSVQITDAFFVVSAFCIFIIGLYIFNEGELRSFCILGTISGVVLYFLVLAPIIGRMMRVVFKAVYMIFHLSWCAIRKIFSFHRKK